MLQKGLSLLELESKQTRGTHTAMVSRLFSLAFFDIPILYRNRRNCIRVDAIVFGGNDFEVGITMIPAIQTACQQKAHMRFGRTSKDLTTIALKLGVFKVKNYQA